MQEINWKYAGPAITEEEIDLVESALTLVLPADYRAFIREHNGARPKPNAVDLPSGREVVMERLLRIESGEKGNLVSVVESLRQQINEQSLVPFGADPFGNLFCFKYSGKTSIAVVFWDHERNSISELCGTFSELVNSLHPAR